MTLVNTLFCLKTSGPNNYGLLLILLVLVGIGMWKRHRRKNMSNFRVATPPPPKHMIRTNNKSTAKKKRLLQFEQTSIEPTIAGPGSEGLAIRDLHRNNFIFIVPGIAWSSSAITDPCPVYNCLTHCIGLLQAPLFNM